MTGWIDLTGLLDPRDAAGVDVLNGIAYDAAGDRLFVTGKLWPRCSRSACIARVVGVSSAIGRSGSDRRGPVALR